MTCRKVIVNKFIVSFCEGRECYDFQVDIGDRRLSFFPYIEFFNNTNYRLHFFISLISKGKDQSTLWETLDEMSISKGIKHLNLK